MISKTAIIKNSIIGKKTRIWHYANIYGCKIGDDCNIGTFVEIQNDVIIHNNVTISSHSFICSLVTIYDNVFIGHGVVTINDLAPPSYKLTGTKSGWKPTYIGKNTFIGSNATIFPVNIGKNVKIGAGAVVTKDVPDNHMAIGVPAKIVKIKKK